jgi:2-amino-4-hydroxy-6-hydroxymethyldihydropteridine diphosphokinase
MPMTDANVDVYVAAGSNVEPEQNLRAALERLTRIFGTLRSSPAYRNKAMGFAGDDFVNLVVGFATEQPLREVRRQLQEIEAVCGRPDNAPKWAARTMDLDILLYGDLVCEEPGLIVPRPDLARRPYMLKPMADLVPQLSHPTLHKSMSELWQAFDAHGHEMVAVDLTNPRFARHPPQ